MRTVYEALSETIAKKVLKNPDLWWIVDDISTKTEAIERCKYCLKFLNERDRQEKAACPLIAGNSIYCVERTK